MQELSAEASKEVALMNQEAWEEAQVMEACRPWYFSPEASTAEEPNVLPEQQARCPTGGFP